MRHVLGFVLTLLILGGASAQQPDVVPGTEPLTWEEEGAELAVRLMDGAHRFIEQKIDDSIRMRGRYWDRDASSAGAYARSVEPNRQRLAEIVGVVDERLPVEMQRFGTEQRPPLVARTESYAVWQVRWPVLEHVWGEGLLVVPEGPPAGSVVLVPDADQTPASLLRRHGAGGEGPVAHRLAEQGFEVVIPTLVGRGAYSGPPADVDWDQSKREWISRQAFYMGRHVIGYEVQKVLAAVDWLIARHGDGTSVGVAGYGEGGLIGLYAAALDRRIDVALVSGYFASRQELWQEPIYRQVWSLLRQFGDAEIASLVAPRALIFEYAPIPDADENKGVLTTPPFEEVQSEFRRLGELVGPSINQSTLVAGPDGALLGPLSREAVETLITAMGARPRSSDSEPPAELRREGFDPDERERRQVEGMVEHVQMLVHESDRTQDRFYLYQVLPELNVSEAPWSTRRGHRIYSAQEFAEASAVYRERYAELIGRFDGPMLPPNARTRKIIEDEAWTAYDVVLDVREELIAWGVLIVPNDLQPGERRPVVVCQHGRNGLPRTTIDADSSYYNLAPSLAEQGFVTFSPHNLYRDESRYRWLDRKAKTVGGTLFSFILDQHEQILNWLNSLPFVDGSRIGLYGKSFGGLTALRVPPILQGYALSISSAYFNEETEKVANPNRAFSYMRTDEWEVPVWNLGNTFGHAEAAYLMVPRPFMVERGMWDLTALDRWVAYEFAKVHFLYTQLGLGERVEIEYFQGGHAINADGTIRFLQKWLKWPEE